MMGHVDVLSRLPLPDSTDVGEEKINFINFGKDLPVDIKDIQEHTL